MEIPTRLDLACKRAKRSGSCPIMRNIGGELAEKIGPRGQKLISLAESGNWTWFGSKIRELNLGQRLPIIEAVFHLNSSNIITATSFASDLNRMRRHEAALDLLKTIPEKNWSIYIVSTAVRALQGLEKNKEAQKLADLGAANDFAGACRELSRIWPGENK